MEPLCLYAFQCVVAVGPWSLGVLRLAEVGQKGLRMLPLVREAGLKPPGHDADKLCLLGEAT
jgi:hypothetical protein